MVTSEDNRRRVEHTPQSHIKLIMDTSCTCTHTHKHTYMYTVLASKGSGGIKMAIGVPKYIFIQKTGELIMHGCYNYIETWTLGPRPL